MLVYPLRPGGSYPLSCPDWPSSLTRTGRVSCSCTFLRKSEFRSSFLIPSYHVKNKLTSLSPTVECIFGSQLYISHNILNNFTQSVQSNRNVVQLSVDNLLHEVQYMKSCNIKIQHVAALQFLLTHSYKDHDVSIAQSIIFDMTGVAARLFV